MKSNSKVPVAVLSCFLIAFVLQGILKISGVFIFEKTLDWEIFAVIDNNLYLQIGYYSLINAIAVYCLSFALTTRSYSNKYYHYILIFGSSVLVTYLRMTIHTPMFVEFIYDTILYILTPVLVNLTTNEKYKLKNGFNGIITMISIQVMLYFCYLGLCYWSGLLNSLLPVIQNCLYASAHFIVFFEMYIGLILTMLSLNIYIRNKKGEN